MERMPDDERDSQSKLRLSQESADVWRVDLQPSPAAWRYAHPNSEGGEPPWALLARFDNSTSTIHTYPRRTSLSFSVLEPKYAPLNEIAFEGFLDKVPQDVDEIDDALQTLPEQFYRDADFGLGIRVYLRPFLSTLGQRGIERLVIAKGRGAAVSESTLVLNSREFAGIARELDRIAKRFSDQSRFERSKHAYNELLAKHFPDRFPPRRKLSNGGLIVSFLRAARQKGAVMAPADRQAIIEHASAEAAAIAKENPQRLYKLQRDFELAGLNELIGRFEVDIEKAHPESFWQELLRLNPFILSMLFGYPIVVIIDQAHIGGMSLGGSGETIVDFLAANESTRSLALVEIKRPDTPLTGGEFREGRFKPSNDLNSAVIQAIDQRYELLVNYKDRARDAGTVHAVDCVIVAGRTPSDPAKLASFEMYRTSLRDVRVLTFDEVLMKLRGLRNYFDPATAIEKPPEELF